MDTSKQIAKHVQQLFFGGNWTCVYVQESLQDVSWEEAITPVRSFNTLATLTFHIGYFVSTVVKVLKGGPLEGHDKFSFDHPPIHSQADWQQLMDQTLANARQLTELIEGLPAEKLDQPFTDEKYGTYARNLLGIIEHTHYHLGQISLIKKMVREVG